MNNILYRYKTIWKGKQMTDISKYKNVSLSKDTYFKIDKIRKVIVPNTIISRSQTINILVNKEEKRLNGKADK